jgi:hypothetical protein
MTRTEIERLAVVETQMDSVCSKIADMDAKIDNLTTLVSARVTRDEYISVLTNRANKLILSVIVVSNFVLGVALALTHLGP